MKRERVEAVPEDEKAELLLLPCNCLEDGRACDGTLVFAIINPMVGDVVADGTGEEKAAVMVRLRREEVVSVVQDLVAWLGGAELEGDDEG